VLEAIMAGITPPQAPQPPQPTLGQVRPVARPTNAVGGPSPINTYPLTDFGDMMMRLQQQGLQPNYMAQPYYGPR
jgi:hypothetical protein